MMEQSMGAERENSRTELNEETVREISKRKNEPEWLLQVRLQALEQFGQLSMPETSYGLHVNAPSIIKMEELKPAETITQNNKSVVNDVVIEDLSVAAIEYENILRPLLMSTDFRSKLDALHTAFWNNGIFIYAPKRKPGSETAQVMLELGQKQTEIQAIVMVAEENASLAVTEILKSPDADTKSYRFEGIGIVAGPNAAVKHVMLQKLGSNVSTIIIRKAMAQKDASVDWVDVTIGGGSTKQETITLLNGEGAKSSITGAFFGDGNQQLDISAKEVHNARNTTSRIQVRGALQGKAKAIVQSFTKIMKNAANSEGHQKANVLLLSDTARASPIPKLEIDNYDVKASHEASVGQLDAEKLFYLMSRGLESKEATRLVVQGFYEPLLKQMPFEELAEELRQTIAMKMEAVETT